MNGRALYQNSGVDVEKGEKLVKWLEEGDEKPENKKDLNDFSASYEPDFSSYKKPLLISSTDGIGTKLILALEEDKLENLGFDLVGMCVNDLYTSGAKPLFFLDYYATSQLDENQFKRVLSSLNKALSMISCPLLGGETAELPGLYQKGHFDLAGFVVGSVDKENRMSPSATKKGDLLYSFASNGFHSNGYSLIRKFLKQKPELKTKELSDNLLRPTKVYHEVHTLFEKLGKEVCHSACHVTGGGISGNLVRILPEGLSAKIRFESLQTPQWMKNFLLNFTEDLMEFESVFNMGSGMILAINKDKKELFEKTCESLNLSPSLIGQVSPSQSSSVFYSHSC